MIETFKKYENRVIQLEDNFIELKLIGAILVKSDDGKSKVVELQLKNNKFTRLEVSYEVYNFIKDSWLEELYRKELEKVRCNTPKNERHSLSDSLKDHITILFNELKGELK